MAESTYDLHGIHATGAGYSHAAHTAQSVGARVRQLRHTQVEARAPVRADLNALQGELARLAADLAADGQFLAHVSNHMGATERQVAAMLAGLGAGSSIFVRMAKDDARAMLRRHHLADLSQDVKYGAKGPTVAALQRRLKAAGFDPGPVDGDYGPLTRKAVQRYQRAHNLPVTGHVDGGTAGHLVNPSHRPSTAPGSTSTPIGTGGSGGGGGTSDGPQGIRGTGDARDVVRLAESQLGEGEHPPGSNNTKYGSWYSAGDPAEPWCARFVSWVYQKSGHPLPHIQDGHGFQYCPAAVTWARQHGVWHAGTHGIQPGDVVMFDWTGDGVSDHTGIATSSAGGDGSVRTIEGNASDVVGRHVRGRGVVMGYFRP